LKKRLIKSPKVYIRDSGMLHTLLELDTATDLFGHPVFGASWEGWCVEQIVHALPEWRASFFRTAAGEEVDLILERGKRRLAFEFKASAAPQLTQGFFSVIDTLQPTHTWIVCPTEREGHSLRDSVRVAGIGETLRDVERAASSA